MHIVFGKRGMVGTLELSRGVLYKANSGGGLKANMGMHFGGMKIT